MQTLHRFPERPDPLLTIVVPCFEEEETIPEFHQRITRVVKRLSVSCEILYVDDGSKDRTADILRHYQDGSSVRYLSLSRNFGKEAALSAGIDHARGSALIFIDVDLQDPPELIAAMVDYWQRGYDVVNMQRNLRIGDSWFKRMSARAYYWVMHRLVEKVDMPTDVSDFRLIGPAPLAALRALDERSRILKGMIGWVAFVPSNYLQSYCSPCRKHQVECSWPVQSGHREYRQLLSQTAAHLQPHQFRTFRLQHLLHACVARGWQFRHPSPARRNGFIHVRRCRHGGGVPWRDTRGSEAPASLFPEAQQQGGSSVTPPFDGFDRG